MKGAYKDILVLALITLAIIGGIVAADVITTSVRFIITSNVAFAVAVPSNGTFVTSGATDQIIFNTSAQSALKVNASVIQSGLTHTQSVVTPIFAYRNDGNRNINITQLLSSFPTCTGGTIEVKASRADGGYQNSCTDNDTANSASCVNLSNLYQVRVIANLTESSNASIWMWADYNTCDNGLDTSVTLTHNSSASGAN